jgi:hypothetical protein
MGVFTLFAARQHDLGAVAAVRRMAASSAHSWLVMHFAPQRFAVPTCMPRSASTQACCRCMHHRLTCLRRILYTSPVCMQLCCLRKISALESYCRLLPAQPL